MPIIVGTALTGQDGKTQVLEGEELTGKEIKLPMKTKTMIVNGITYAFVRKEGSDFVYRMVTPPEEKP